MDQPPPAVSHEALQHQAWLLWDAAGRPTGKSEHFWLLAEQELAKSTPAAKRKKPPASPTAPAAETAPVHPSRKKSSPTAAAKSATKSPAKSAKKAPAKAAPPAAKTPAKTRKPKAGEAP